MATLTIRETIGLDQGAEIVLDDEDRTIIATVDREGEVTIIDDLPVITYKVALYIVIKALVNRNTR